MSWLALSQLPTIAGQERRPIAWHARGERPELGAFQRNIAAVARQARSSGMTQAALIADDGYRFAAALLGLLAAGIGVLLPPSAQPGTLARLRNRFDGLVSDRPELIAAGAIAIGAEDATPDATLTFDADRAEIDFATSGSTGAPKLIRRSLGQFERESAVIHQSWASVALSSGPVLAMVPHHHVYGLSFKICWPLATGRAFAPASYDHWESLLAELPPGAQIVSSPAHLARLGGLAPIAPARRPSLILSAGAPLPEEAAADCRALFGVDPTEIYGSTETGALAQRRRSANAAAPAWQALCGIETRIDPDGRLAVRGSHLGSADWQETADRAAIAGKGFLLQGRIDRIAKIEGKRVDLEAVERALTELPDIAAAALCVIPGKIESLGAVVVLSAAGKAGLAAQGAFRLSRRLRHELASDHEPMALPRRWRFVDELPRGALGKPVMLELLALFD